MAQNKTAIQLIGGEITKIFEPVKVSVQDGEILTLLAQMGVQFPPALETAPGFPGALSNLIANIEALPVLIQDIITAIDAEDFETLADKTLELIDIIKETIEDLETMSSTLAGLDFTTEGISAGELADYALNLVENLLNYLIVTYIESYSEGAVGIMEFFGMIERTPENVGSTNPLFPEYIKKTINFNNIGEFFKSPPNVLKMLYGWGENSFDGKDMLEKMNKIFLGFGLPSVYTEIPTELDVMFLSITPYTIDGSSQPVVPPGLKFLFNEVFEANASTIIEGENWTLELGVENEIPVDAGVTVEPDGNLTLIPPSGSLDGKVFAEWIMNNGGNPLLLLGDLDASNFQANQLSLLGEANFSIDSGSLSLGELKIEGELKEGKIVIKPKNPDGFLAKILPEGGMIIDLDFILGVSSEEGVYFHGSAGFEIQLPFHIEIGPLEIKNITLAVKFGGPEIPIEIGADIKLELGPFTAVVENMGLKTLLSFPDDKKGNLGPMNMDIKFKPPAGIGMSVDAETFKGGGFISFDFENERYVGVLELTVKDTISIKIIGILTTKLPGNDDGYSLLLLITAEFSPIQLSFGFTLNGVGGIIALHRTMDLQVLRDGVKTNSLDNILFPDDPVGNISEIITDLEAAFPIAEGRYAFGPMGIIGWGSPSLITLEIGLMIEVPAPVRLAILGIIKAILPDEDNALLKLQINFIGTIDFEAKFITFDASLFDSRLLTFTLAGDIAFRLKYGDEPNFLFSIGGFHPSYTPPPLALPALQRLTINLLGGDNPRLTLTTYFAITSNTIQFGAGVDFYLKITNKAKVLGNFGFDVLIQFSPFYFIAEIYASFGVYWKDDPIFSINLGGLLEGPKPWHVKGYAEFKILGIKFKAQFDKTFGDTGTEALPDVEVLPLLVEQINDPINWIGELPAGSNLLVNIREADSNSQELVAHPNGVMAFSQKTVPLDMTINKFGNMRPADYQNFSLDIADGGGTNFAETTVKEFFAPAEFIALTNSQKLARKSFERFNSGVSIKGTEDIASSQFMERKLEYEAIIFDDIEKPPVTATEYMPEKAEAFRAWTRGTAAGRSSLSRSKKPISALAPTKVGAKQEEFIIANVEDLERHPGMNADMVAYEDLVFNQTEALVLMNELIEKDPSLQDTLQVVPAFELA
jgi:hypothetical protein